MKKLIGLVICSAFMLCACNEAKAEKKVEAPAKAAPAAPAQAKAAEPAPAPEAPKAQITNIVRTPGEVAEGTAPGSINIPLQEAEQRLGEFPKDKDLLIFCRSGKRSMAVSNFLIQNGYERVFNVVGGFMAFPKN